MDALLVKIRKLEKELVSRGRIEDYEVKSSEDMRQEAWECYLVGRLEWLEHVKRDADIDEAENA